MITGGTIRFTSSGSRAGIGETATVNVVACKIVIVIVILIVIVIVIVIVMQNIHLGYISFDSGSICHHN